MDNTNEVYIRYKFGDNEMEARGSSDFVNQHSMAFLRAASNSSEQMRLPILEQVEEASNQSEEVEEIQNTVSNSGASGEKSIDGLLQFFIEKSPEKQSDQILVISYFFQKYLGHEMVVLEDYECAFKVLKKTAVKAPSNMKSGVRNVVDRTDLLYTPERGVFALTLQGERYVENMENEE